MDSIDLPIVGTFLWLAGLCVGSFLNVVIYRLPRDLSVGSPLWSFCPACGSKIAFRDNLPLLSWLLLRGRCRHCAAPISVQYPLVESLTGMLFIVVLYLLFSANSRADLVHLRMPNDIPLLLCWLTLVAVMVVCSSTDIVSYMIDVRVTNLAVALGMVFHTAWPRRTWLSQDALPNGYDLCWLGIGLAAVIWMWITRPRFDEEPDEDAPEEAGQAPTGEAHTAPTTLQVDHEITTAPDGQFGARKRNPHSDAGSRSRRRGSSSADLWLDWFGGDVVFCRGGDLAVGGVGLLDAAFQRFRPARRVGVEPGLHRNRDRRQFSASGR